MIAIGVGAGAEQLPMEPPHNSGQSITAAYEGWFKNPDGGFSLLVGYYNRNLKQEIDVPIGPGNRIEPGGPDRGQPTHFLPNRQWGMFTITVPRDFGDQKLTWTIEANGQPTVVPLSLNPLWELSPFVEASGNTPPFVGFSEKGPYQQGPRPTNTMLQASVDEPLQIATGFPYLEQVPRPGDRNIFQGSPAGRACRIPSPTRYRVSREGHHDCDVQRAGGLYAAGDGQRFIRSRRRRLSVLLD